MSNRRITSVHEIRSILTDVQWRVRPAGHEMPDGLRGSLAGDIFAGFARMTDGDKHQHRKQIVIQQIDALGGRDVPTVVGAILRRYYPVSPHDLQFLVPGAVIAHLMGVPESDQHELVEQVRALVIGSRPGASESDSQAAIQAMERAVPTIASTAVSGEQNDLDVLAAKISLLFQASDACAAMIGNALIALADIPYWTKADGASIVRQSMKARVPVRSTTRTRDEESVVVDLECAHKQHPDAEWTFGFGLHACPGRMLAIEIAIACINEVIGRQPFDATAVRSDGWHDLPNVWIPDLFLENGAAK